MYLCLFTIVVGTGLDINSFLLMGRACRRRGTCEPCGGLIGHPLVRGQAQVGGQAGAQASGRAGGLVKVIWSLKFIPFLVCVHVFWYLPYGGC